MRKHIYLHTSIIPNIEHIDNDDLFEPTYNYNKFEFVNAHPNEWGRIKTKQNYFHIFVGQIRNLTPKCHWCNNELSLIPLQNFNGNSFTQWCLQCTSCLSRGPSLNINDSIEKDSVEFEYLKALMQQRYTEIRQWDADINSGDK